MSAPVVLHVVGARPNFMKAAPVLRALADRGVQQQLVHTGQHYDPALSEVFFEQLDLPQPDVHLGVGSGTHGQQTGLLMQALEPVLVQMRPDLLVVYGDVNSTLAAALVAAKLQLPVAHVEAGLRSFDRTMPEEINRLVTDALADLLFTTSPEARANLLREGVDGDRIHFVGNPMIDTLLENMARFDAATARRSHGLAEKYAVATLHRPANVDDPDAATRVAQALGAVAAQIEVALPLHPRGHASLERAGLLSTRGVRVLKPLPYVEFISLVRGATLVVTDSGGIQEETTILGVPCLTLRPNTERPITISHGTNRLVTPAQLPTAAADVLDGGWKRPATPPPLWDGHAGERIADVVATWDLDKYRPTA
jgi:UDP-N-acetylglucosamine 2-epimerase (non-hydrolysing)